MLGDKISKWNLSISRIGISRFWFGIALGLITALILNLYFSVSRESLRFFSQIGNDLLILSEYDHWFFNYFFSCLSVSLGLLMTGFIWLGNRIHKSNRDSRYKKYGRTLLMLYFWLIILAITRIGTILFYPLHSLRGYDNHLDLSKDYKWMFVAIVFVSFTLTWSMLRRVYNSTKWLLMSIPILILVSLLYTNLCDIDPSTVNEAHLFYYKDYHKYIDDEILFAHENYEISFENEAISNLKKWKTEGAIRQMVDVSIAFTSNKALSLDTIILGKIVFHNLKQGINYRWTRPANINWQYPQPIYIYRQFNKFEIGSNESKELLDIIKDQIQLWNVDRLKEYRGNDASTIESDRIFFAKYEMPERIVNQLKYIRDSLMNTLEFTNHYEPLPEIMEYTPPNSKN